jgi:radical SAM superfamily enzyme YgiQ (UPF0313 family)
MARAGCVGINFGVESVADKVLEGAGRKNILPQDFFEIIGICNRLGIDTFCFFIIGLPDDDAETILDTINFALTLNPTAAQFTIFTPYFGTELRRRSEELGLIEQGGAESMTSYKSMVRTEKLTQSELQKFRNMAAKIWELNVRTRNEIELKENFEELNRLKSTSWYKIYFACRHIIRQITSFVC